MRDHDNTLLLPVTLAEELPVQETSELVVRARDRVGIQVGPIVINAVLGDPFPPGLSDLGQRLARLPGDTTLGQLPPIPVLARCASRMSARHRLHQTYIEKLNREHDGSTRVLPLLPEGIREPEDVATLGALLVDEAPGEEDLR